MAVTGGIGTHEGLLSVKDGPENESNFTITATGKDGGCVLGSYMISTNDPVEPLQRPTDG